MATTTVMCLFREPLPPGNVSSTTAGVTEVHVDEDDRRVAEITIEKPKMSLVAKAKSSVYSIWGTDAKLGNVELVIPEGEFSSRRHMRLRPRSSACNVLTDRIQRLSCQYCAGLCCSSSD